MQMNKQAKVKPMMGKSLLQKHFLRGHLLALSMLAGFAFTSDALARSDSILTVVTPSDTPSDSSGGTSGDTGAKTDNNAPDQNQSEQGSAPLDLTNLLKADDGDNTSNEVVLENADNATELAADHEAPVTAPETAKPTISLKR